MTKVQSVRGIAIQTGTSLWYLRNRINGYFVWSIQVEKWSSVRKLEKWARARLCTFINQSKELVQCGWLWGIMIERWV